MPFRGGLWAEAAPFPLAHLVDFGSEKVSEGVRPLALRIIPGLVTLSLNYVCPEFDVRFIICQ